VVSLLQLGYRPTGVKPPSHIEKQRKLAEEVAKTRKKEQDRVEEKQRKIEKMKSDQHWAQAKESLEADWMEKIVLPFERMTGITSCREIHAEPDEEEEVSDDDERPAARARANQNETAARNKARRIIAKAVKKDESSSDEEEV